MHHRRGGADRHSCIDMSARGGGWSTYTPTCGEILCSSDLVGPLRIPISTWLQSENLCVVCNVRRLALQAPLLFSQKAVPVHFGTVSEVLLCKFEFTCFSALVCSISFFYVPLFQRNALMIWTSSLLPSQRDKVWTAQAKQTANLRQYLQSIPTNHSDNAESNHKSYILLFARVSHWIQ